MLFLVFPTFFGTVSLAYSYWMKNKFPKIVLKLTPTKLIYPFYFGQFIFPMDYWSLPNLSHTLFLKEVYCNLFFSSFFPQILQSCLSSLFDTKKQYSLIDLLILVIFSWIFSSFHPFYWKGRRKGWFQRIIQWDMMFPFFLFFTSL